MLKAMTSAKTRGGWQAIAVVAVACGLMMAGIGGAGAATGPSATSSRAANVEIENFLFSPAKLTIAKGSSVAFSNASTASHTATRAGTFDTGTIKPGKSVSVRFKQKGSFPYHCEIHPQMRGKIVVN
jgi:plastocyanin